MRDCVLQMTRIETSDRKIYCSKSAECQAILKNVRIQSVFVVVHLSKMCLVNDQCFPVATTVKIGGSVKGVALFGVVRILTQIGRQSRRRRRILNQFFGQLCSHFLLLRASNSELCQMFGCKVVLDLVCSTVMNVELIARWQP